MRQNWLAIWARRTYLWYVFGWFYLSWFFPRQWTPFHCFDNTILIQMSIMCRMLPMQSHVLSDSWIHNLFSPAPRLYLITHYKCVIVIVFRNHCIFTLFGFCYVAKTHNVACPCALARKWVVPFVLSQYHSDILTLRLLLLALQHFMYHTRHHISHHKLLHRHYFEGNDQILVRRWQTLEQSHNDVFVSCGYLQPNELIRKRLHLVDVV